MEKEIIAWLPTVIVIIGVFGQAMYFKGVFGTKIEQHDKQISDLKENHVRKDTCQAIENGIDDRLCRLEMVANGGISHDPRRH